MVDARNRILINERGDPAEKSRGARLFEYLVEQANHGNALGVGYAQLPCLVHGFSSFEDLVHRPYRPSDTDHVLSSANQITKLAGGRRGMSRGGVRISAGMDTFIWQKKHPHHRSEDAFEKTPYSKPDWLVVFPDDSRRLVGCTKGRCLPLSELQTLVKVLNN